MTVFNFTQEQQTAINTTEGIVCLSAGPGCGKTFVLVNRYIAILKKLIASGVLAEEAFGKILAVTFTRKAAHEMKERIVKELKEFDAQKIKHNIRISTIDGWASSFLKEFSENPDFELVDNTFAKAKFLEIAQKLFDSYDVKDMELPKRPKDLFVDIFYFLGKLKSQLITPQQFPENSKLAKFIKEVAEIFDAWMLENNYLVYADLLFYTHQVFQNQPEILKEYAEAIEYILIDEYQDLNDAQDQVLRMISRENYFLVGDIGQSIYGFRAANYRNMLDYRNFKAEYSLSLSQNFRSTQNIVDFTNLFFDGTIYQNLQATRDTGDKIKLLLSDNVQEEAKKIAGQISELLTIGYKLDDIKILLRSMPNVWVYVDALENLNIPFVILGGSEFGRREETLDLLSILRLITNPKDEEALARLLTSEIFGYELYELALIEKKVPEIIEDFRLQNLRPLDLFEYILKKLEYFKYIHTLEKTNFHRHLDTIEKFRIILREYEKKHLLYSLTGFLDFYASVESESFSLFLNEEVNDLNAIALMTVHASKGLEFPVVFVCAAKIPNKQALLHFHKEHGLILKDTPEFKEFLKEKLEEEFKEEEERVFYVAATRAKEKLFLASYKSHDKYNLFVEKILGSEKFSDIVEICEEGKILKQVQNDRTFFIEPTKFYDDIKKLVVKKKKYFYSVSEFELYGDCPYKYYLLKEFGLKITNDLANFGNAVHDYMEKPFDLVGFDEVKTQKFLSWYEKYDLASKKVLAKEQNFVWKVGEHFVRGTIDRVDDFGDTVAIIDYKTSEKLQPEKYEFSMNVYAAAYEAVFGKKVSELKLVYPLLDEECLVRRKDVKLEILEIIEKIEAENFEKNKLDCKFCELKKFARNSRDFGGCLD